jgi:UDP-glucose 4-epimerase
MKGKNKVACEIFNLGSGTGHTVLEVINSFEKVSGVALTYSIGPRRAGDVMAIYANNSKATEILHWKISYTLDEMMKTAWDWELNLQKQISNQ